jgi:hypothetical protein
MADRDRAAAAEPTEAERAQAAMDAAVEAEKNRADETVPGGRYEVDGKLVDANGEPIKGKKD